MTSKAMKQFLQLPLTAVRTEDALLFSLAAYNEHFRNTVYVILASPPHVRDDWEGMRCTCQGDGVHAGCEHTAYVRTPTSSTLLSAQHITHTRAMTDVYMTQSANPVMTDVNLTQ